MAGTVESECQLHAIAKSNGNFRAPNPGDWQAQPDPKRRYTWRDSRLKAVVQCRDLGIGTGTARRCTNASGNITKSWCRRARRILRFSTAWPLALH
jgi:hypothetical protein